MTLQFYVNRQKLNLSPSQKGIKIMSDSKNYLKASFVFQTSEWLKGTVFYALFTHSGKTYKKFLGVEEGVGANECFVPPEVIKPGIFEVSVYCDNLITSSVESIEVEQSGYTENIENQKTSPTVLEQMNQMMYNYARLCNDIYKKCEETLNKIQEDKD